LPLNRGFPKSCAFSVEFVNVEYLNAAIMIELRGIYHYFLAYVKHDYFERKYLNIAPNWEENKKIKTF